MLLHITLSTIALGLIAVTALTVIACFFYFVLANLFTKTEIIHQTHVVNVHGDLIDKDMNDEYERVKIGINDKKDIHNSSWDIERFKRFNNRDGFNSLLEDLKIEYSALLVQHFGI